MLPVRILLSLLLLAAAPARACLLCEGPESPPPRFNEEPSAPYNLKAEYALTEGELEHILGLEGGRRFRVRGAFIEDLSAPPETHLLNTGRVIAFVKEPSNRTYEELFKRYSPEVLAGRRPALSAEDHDKALHLVWSRIGLFDPEEAGFLRGLLPAQDLKAGLDCSPGSEGLCVSSPGALGPAPVLPKAGMPPVWISVFDPVPLEGAGLRDRLRKSLKFDDHGNAEEKKGLDQLVDWLMLSPTARELAEEFLKEGVPVKLSFEEMANSRIVEGAGGQKLLYGTGGETLSWKGTHHVKINKDYLQVDPLSFKTHGVSTLGHELFGHAFKHIQAEKLNLTTAYHYYKNNETNAGVVGWIIGSEVSHEFRLTYSNAHMWNYVEDPEKYRRKLEVIRSYYAKTMSPEEMKDPIPVLEERLAAVRAELANIRGDIVSQGRWKKVVEHFISRHGSEYKAENFSALLDEIDKDITLYLPARTKDAEDIDVGLQKEIAYFRTRGGKRRIADFGSEKAQAFLRGEEEALAKRTAQLKEVLKKHNRQAPSAAVPAAGQINLDDLKRMVKDDLKANPSHYK